MQVVLRDFSLEVPGGRVVALVGMSGGGELFVTELLRVTPFMVLCPYEGMWKGFSLVLDDTHMWTV